MGSGHKGSMILVGIGGLAWGSVTEGTEQQRIRSKTYGLYACRFLSLRSKSSVEASLGRKDHTMIMILG